MWNFVRPSRTLMILIFKRSQKEWYSYVSSRWDDLVIEMNRNSWSLHHRNSMISIGFDSMDYSYRSLPMQWLQVPMRRPWPSWSTLLGCQGTTQGEPVVMGQSFCDVCSAYRIVMIYTVYIYICTYVIYYICDMYTYILLYTYQI